MYFLEYFSNEYNSLIIILRSKHLLKKVIFGNIKSTFLSEGCKNSEILSKKQINRNLSFLNVLFKHHDYNVAKYEFLRKQIFFSPLKYF